MELTVRRERERRRGGERGVQREHVRVELTRIRKSNYKKLDRKFQKNINCNYLTSLTQCLLRFLPFIQFKRCLSVYGVSYFVVERSNGFRYDEDYTLQSY